jgi:hypothetical protein
MRRVPSSLTAAGTPSLPHASGEVLGDRYFGLMVKHFGSPALQTWKSSLIVLTDHVVAGGGVSLGGGAAHLGAALTFVAFVSTCTHGCEAAPSPAEKHTVAKPPATSTCTRSEVAESFGTHARGGSTFAAALALVDGDGVSDEADGDVEGGVVADGLLGEQA